MNLLKWLGFTQQDLRYGPAFYEIIFSKSGGNAHALRINIFYVRRFFTLVSFVVLSAALWLVYISYNHHQLSQEIADLEKTKAHLRHLEQEKRKQRIAQDVMEGDYAKLAARLYDVEQQVRQLNARSKWSKQYIDKAPANNTMGMGGPLEAQDPQTWMSAHGIAKLDYLEQMLAKMQSIPRGMPIHPNQTRLSSHFGYRGNPFTGEGREFHNGLDFASPTGTPIFATAPGRVSAAGYMGGLGYAVKLEHGHGFETAFGHMSKVLVREGTAVDAGDLIGLVGSTGRSSGPHLHYVVYYNGKAIDPIDFVD